MEAALQILAYLLPIIVEGIRSWDARNKGANHNANIQIYRKALAQADAGRIAALHADQHDRVLSAVRGH